MTKNTGKYLEEVVELIERSINPNATVELDVQMPIINSRSGKTTQCDVVITSGQKPRETITIVEVQDRTSQVKPNDFRGWQLKLEEIGAQHLICVSRMPFPESIIEKASSSGSKINLIRIEDLKVNKIPLHLLNYEFTDRYFSVKEWTIQGLTYSESEQEKLSISEKNPLSGTKTNDKVFSYDKKNLISFFEIAKMELATQLNKKSKFGEDKISILFDDTDFYFNHPNGFLKIGIEIEFKWEYSVNVIPMKTMSYEQDEYGVLAWMLESDYQSNKGPVKIKLPIIKSGNKYRIGIIKYILPNDMELNMKIYRGKNN